MSPPISYDLLLFSLSVVIAIVASLAALLIAFRLRQQLERFAILAKLGSAGVMGCAISGMHYTGMAAAHFAPGSICMAAASGGLKQTTLGLVIGGFAMAIMSVTLILSALDAHFGARNARLASSLQLAKDAAEAALSENKRITAELRAAQSQLVTTGPRSRHGRDRQQRTPHVGNVLNSVTYRRD